MAYYFRGNSQIWLEEYEQAIADLTMAIELDVEPGQSYYNRGVARLALRDQDLAIEDFEMVIAVSEDPQLITGAEDLLAGLGEKP